MRKSYAEKAKNKALRTGKLGIFCCLPAVRSMFSKHAKTCSVWKR